MSGGPYGNWIGQYAGDGGYVYDIYDTGWVRIVRSPTGSSGEWVSPSSAAGVAINAELTSRYPDVAAAMTRGTQQAANAANQRSAQRTQTPSQGTQVWSTIQQATDVFGPLVVDLVGTIAGNAGNSQANIAGRIAKLKAQISMETNPVKRAKMQAELDSLQAQQSTYNQITQQGIVPINAGYTPTLMSGDMAGQTSWLPWVIGGGVGLVALAVATGGKR